ncbi:MAG: hypothetical protein K1000chlam2_01344 [Chlamydiae bacterium]|nr:hypothetical protein [Chlamydiota bacterium]
MSIINKISKGVDFGLRFVLEVCGAGGAVWGASEAMGLRHSDDQLNNTCWRIAAIGIGTLGLMRFAYLNSSKIRNFFERAQEAAAQNTLPITTTKV